MLERMQARMSDMIDDSGYMVGTAL
jgi:hypothetical protein